MLKINLQSIHYFLKVAETLNFTEAAKELYVSQPALSKQIRQLELSVGVQLLKRNTKQVELTEGGKIMFNAWSQAIGQINDALVQAHEANAKSKKKLRIGLLEFGGVIDTLMPLLEKYADSQEEFEIEYATYGFTQLKEKLKKRELDIIFSFSSEIPAQNAGISFRILKDMDLNIIVSKKNRFYGRETLEVKELKDETFYIFSNAYSDEAKNSIVSHCQKDGFYPAKIKFFPNITSLAIALTSGTGVTIGYRVFFSDMGDRLKFFPIKEEIGKHYIVMAWEEKKEEQLQDLLEFLKERI
ncbi:LysR family transcriptional regulator [Konateibacter massiliensis]|uniref:LysR family transcriptional regulator n=1 Tax=Konateibacter massiliensis TaxID=2002841 RepID=UPI000C1506B8|nr:LysR family transcriptional regulator [Konateibacter massiliensis]